MVHHFVKNTLLKVVLPGALLVGALVRPSFISIGYLVLSFVAAFLPLISADRPIPKSVGAYNIITLLYSVVLSISIGIYQGVEKGDRPDESTYPCNDFLFLRSAGFIRVHAEAGFYTVLPFLPEIIVVPIALISTIVIVFLSHRQALDIVGDSDETPLAPSSPRSAAGRSSRLAVSAITNAFKRLTNVGIVVLTAIVGNIQPSLLNFVYFGIFLIMVTLWAAYKPIRHKLFNKIKLFWIFYSAAHFTAIYTYQIPIVHQKWLPVTSVIKRLIGLSLLADAKCPEYWNYHFVDVDNDPMAANQWPKYANPGVILVFFYISMVQYYLTQGGTKMPEPEEDDGSSSVHEERMIGGTNDTLETTIDDGENNDEEATTSRGRGNTQLLAESSDTTDELQTSQGIPMRKVTSQVVDRSKISQIFHGPGDEESVASKGLIAIISFIIYHSYTLALAAMMVWALLYHSIFGLILLFLTCSMWIFADTRKVSFLLSPLVVFYIQFLLLIQYLLSMDIQPEMGSPKWMDWMGLTYVIDPVEAFAVLAVKTLLSLPVFLLLRLARREKHYESLTDYERARKIRGTYGTFTQSHAPVLATDGIKHGKSTKLAELVHYLSNRLSIYFIFVVLAYLVFVATDIKPTFYTIGFFALWGLNIALFKASFVLYKNVAYVFWLFLTFYTSAVIICLYAYQFKGFSNWFQLTTGLDSEWLNAIGLVDYAALGKSGLLFLRLLSPIGLFVVTMLQLKFFHGPWSRAVSDNREGQTEEDLLRNGSVPQTPDERLAKQIYTFLHELSEFTWRVLETHVTKIVFLIIAIHLSDHINAVYIPLAIFLSLATSLPTKANGLFSFLMCVYLVLVALVQMVYQLDLLPELASVNRQANSNCTSNVSLTQWFGLEKKENELPRVLLWGLLKAIVALAIQSIVLYRQRHHRVINQIPESEAGRIWPAFDINTYDQSLFKLFQFASDFAFFKFGYEICILFMGIDAWIRMDFLGLIQCLWIIVFALNRRPVVRRFWVLYVVYMAIIYPLQFLMYVGLPPDSCVPYPWDHLLSSAMSSKHLSIWLSLPTYSVVWNPSYLKIDFVVLLLACCQLHVFWIEGDENETIYEDEEYVIKPDNPRYDFIDIKKSAVDYLKVLAFHYGHWITLIATLAAGIAGTSLFALGYIVITLWLLWQGNNLYVMNSRTRSFRTTLTRWNLLLTYTLFTIFMKVCMQLFGCVFISWFDLNTKPWDRVLCVLRQLFSIICVNDLLKDGTAPSISEEKTCPVDLKEAMIGYDVIALAFLMFQIRVFHSWYFQHCMIEYRAEVIFANRGAVLKNQLIEKQMKEQNDQQENKFDEIRKRTDAIRERYQKQLERGGNTVVEPQTYAQAKRAGDYYMFKYDPETDDLVEPPENFVPEVDPHTAAYGEKLDPGQLMYAATAHDLNLAKTLKQVKQADEKEKENEGKIIAAVTETQRKEAGVCETDAPVPAAEKETKLETFIKFIQKLITSGMDMCSVQLNKLCREHRYVGFVLQMEKEKLKNGYSESLSNTSRKLTDLRGDVDMTSLRLVSTARDVDKMESEALTFWEQKSSVMRLLNALVNCVAAHTDIICYFFTIMSQCATGGLLTMPLPLMALCWGNLSSPRPSKFFWVTMITYTEFVIVVKFICQFSFFPFNTQQYINEHQIEPMSMDKVFGVTKQERFAVWDIFLLFSLFFHRYMLRKFGLWKDANHTDTFTSAPTASEIVRKESGNVDGPLSEETAEEPTTSEGDKDKEPEEERGPFGRFIHQLFHPKFRYIRDMYPIMFALDVVCFLIITFGYSSFGEGGSGSVIDDINASRIPITLVLMLIIMTCAIIVDRALYLRKSVLGKLIYQLVTIAFIHVWITLILPEITKRPASANRTAQIFYVVKSLYLLVSAWQIRNGYPRLCIGNLLTHSYGMLNMVAFKVFMNVPFLFELRTAIDWTWTDTSMPLFDFFTMENFYALLFNLKCARSFESAYPAPRGVAKGMVVKYFMGFPIIFGIVIFVWSPLLAWSLLNQIGTISMPEKVTLSVALEGYPPLYSMEAQGKSQDNNELRLINDEQLRKLTDTFSKRYQPQDPESILKSRQSTSYLKGYTADDILIVRFRPESQVYWPISKDSVDAMADKLMQVNASVNFMVTIEFTRPFDKSENKASTHAKSWLSAIPNDPAIRKQISDALKSTSKGAIQVAYSFPEFVQVANQGELLLPSPIIDSIIYKKDEPIPTSEDRRREKWFDHLNLNLATGTVPSQLIWEVDAEHTTNSTVFLDSDNTPYSGRPYLQLVAFVDRAFPSFLAKVFKGGVMAVYLSVIIVVGRTLVRGLFSKSPRDIMYEEIPNPDHMLKICLDIYLVREAKDFFLEQDLFSKLIFLFRSPATMIEWTRLSKKKTE